MLSTDAKQMAAQAYRMDFILDTVAVTYPRPDQISTAFARLERADVRYRSVLDLRR